MKKSTLLIIGVVVVGICCVGIVGVVLIGGLAGSDTASPLTRDSGDPGIAPTPIPPAPSFQEIEGTQVIQWRGWVDEVDGAPGRYEVHVDMDSPDDILSYAEVSFIVDDDLALSLTPDQAVTFNGVIETAQDFVGALDIELEYAVIE
jgi:hypothetical protein